MFGHEEEETPKHHQFCGQTNRKVGTEKTHYWLKYYQSSWCCYIHEYRIITPLPPSLLPTTPNQPPMDYRPSANPDWIQMWPTFAKHPTLLTPTWVVDSELTWSTLGHITHLVTLYVAITRCFGGPSMESGNPACGPHPKAVAPGQDPDVVHLLHWKKQICH